MRSERVGSFIGALGGLAFVLVNTGPLPGPAAWVLRILGLLAFLVVLSLVVVPRRAGAGDEVPPSRRQIRVYGISVTAMAVAILVGARLLAAAGREDLVVLWVVIAVGAHFVPFGRAFHLPFFARLGWLLVVLGLAGAVVALVSGLADVPSWVAVVAGLVLLGASLRPAVRRRTHPDAPS